MNDDPVDLAGYRIRKARRPKVLGSGRSGDSPVGSKRPCTWFCRSSSEPTEASLPLGKGEVSCPRCQTPISGSATRCLNCGLHFSGRAEDFVPKKGRSIWVTLVISALLLVFLVATVV